MRFSITVACKDCTTHLLSKLELLLDILVSNAKMCQVDRAVKESRDLDIKTGRDDGGYQTAD